MTQFNEVGFLVNKEDFVMRVIFGTPASVTFPIDYILEMHKKFPGWINVLAHTHPCNFMSLSSEDDGTLKALAMAFYPYIIYMDVVCYTDLDDIVHKRYWYEIQSKEDWIAQGKGERKIVRHNRFIFEDHCEWKYKMLEFSHY